MADEQRIEIPGLPEGHPPLMIFVNKPVAPSCLAYIRDTLAQSLRDRRAVIFEPGVYVYQMIDGRWQLIHPDG